MSFTIDLNFLSFLFEGNIFYFIRQFLILIVILLVLLIILRICWKHWLDHIKKQYLAIQKYVLLSIDVPRDNEQGPEAIERFFSHLAGIKIKPTWREKYFEGHAQLDISLEIVSLEGQIRFLIYTPIQFRDLVEAAIYATYPGVEISEFDDYTKKIPDEFPNNEYDLWGADIGLYNKNPFPIRTYPNFEHTLTKELKDPIIDLLEILGKLQKGEQVWIQFIIRPAGIEFKKQGEEIVKSMMGEKADQSENIVDKTSHTVVKIGQGISDFTADALGVLFPTEAEKKREEKKIISPGEKRVIEAIQNKISKIAFETRVRLIYIGEKQVFSRDRGVIGVLSAFNAVNTLDMNGLEPEKRTVIPQRPKRVEKKKTAIKKAYQERARYWRREPKGLTRILKTIAKFLAIDFKGYRKKNILNIEELATLYHFPVVGISPPLIKKTGSKRAEPPFSLPVK
ncbi:hypothetical protein KKG58_03180 [Patescibacteria group bacterium]|nr:hypothetical protein [Patescibacteria group bacterium]